MRTKTSLLLFTTFLLLSGRLSAQGSNAVESLENLYNNSSVYQQHLVNGREYSRYNIYFTQGNPYFISDSLSPASFEYDGRRYTDVPLIYDMIEDIIATHNINNTKLVKLVKPKLKWFTIHGSSFEYLRNVDNKLEGGYYEVLYQGSLKIIKKDKREIIDDKRLGQGVKKNVKSTITYYVYKENRYVTVNSVSALIKAIGDKNEELEDFARKNKRNHKNAGLANALQRTAAYYDQLTR